MDSIDRVFGAASRADRVGVTVTRVGLIVVLLWIGGLKAFRYEADGIVPFVANSPTMSFFYNTPAEYKAHMNPEGALVPANRDVARGEPHLYVRLRSGGGDRPLRAAAVPAPLAAAGRRLSAASSSSSCRS